MNYQISDEQSMILDSLRAFLEQEVYPYETEADRAGEVPIELGRWPIRWILRTPIEVEKGLAHRRRRRADL